MIYHHNQKCVQFVTHTKNSFIGTAHDCFFSAPILIAKIQSVLKRSIMLDLSRGPKTGECLSVEDGASTLLALQPHAVSIICIGLLLSAFHKYLTNMQKKMFKIIFRHTGYISNLLVILMESGSGDARTLSSRILGLTLIWHHWPGNRLDLKISQNKTFFLLFFDWTSSGNTDLERDWTWKYHKIKQTNFVFGLIFILHQD